MVNMYVEERVGQMRAAALRRELACWQSNSTGTPAWHTRLIHWLHRRKPAWATAGDTIEVTDGALRVTTGWRKA